jgi:hypothetical protein
MNELKPCPFCIEVEGRDEYLPHEYKNPPIGQRRVTCGYCGCDLSYARWQMRPLEDALRADVEYLTNKKQTIFDLCMGTIKRRDEKIANLHAENKRLSYESEAFTEMATKRLSELQSTNYKMYYALRTIKNMLAVDDNDMRDVIDNALKGGE